ncbi:unnamed protein product [Moneuplotes crassus]|uniref:RING-type domain-containing protein n=1 Tax=Euplotes crassus TaxID=5936 RepID=A0AAD1Y5K5_EUPCR|nr:unnamed protein product [Moneuplotes crassus]
MPRIKGRKPKKKPINSELISLADENNCERMPTRDITHKFLEELRDLSSKEAKKCKDILTCYVCAKLPKVFGSPNSCLHYLCKECIDNFSKEGKEVSCPTCRQSIKNRRYWRYKEKFKPFLKILQEILSPLENDKEEDSFSEMKPANLQEQISKLTREIKNCGADPSKREQRNKKKKELVELIQMRDSEHQKTTVERMKKDQQTRAGDHNEKSINSTNFIYTKNYYSFHLWHDDYQHQNEVECHPKLHMIGKKSKVQIKHICMFLAFRHKMDINNYRQFQVALMGGIDSEMNCIRIPLDNPHSYLPEILASHNYQQNCEIHLVYKLTLD